MSPAGLHRLTGSQLKPADTFADPFKLTGIFNVAKQNVAIDSGLDLLSFAKQASNLTGGNVTYYTLPMDHFGKDPLREDVNFVNLPLIQATASGPVNGSRATPWARPSSGSRAVCSSASRSTGPSVASRTGKNRTVDPGGSTSK